MAQTGSFQPRRMPRIHLCPMRSKAFFLVSEGDRKASLPISHGRVTAEPGDGAGLAHNGGPEGLVNGATR
eukprot:9204115-Lingulodinium_polyedra.AAC.1